MNQNKQRRATATPPAEDVAFELLEPILRFLAASGMSRETATSAFESAWRNVSKDKAKVRIERLAQIDLYGDLVGLWNRHPKYIDQHGGPRDLAMGGPYGFRTLVAAVDESLSADLAASVLVTYGNVSKLKNSKLRLLKPFFHVRTKSAVAFEPSARFLSDASATVNILIRPEASKDSPNLFWRIADSSHLSSRQLKPFLDYARRRSLVFLQEIDDWLQAHVDPSRTNMKRARAGLGIFSICTEQKENSEC